MESTAAVRLTDVRKEFGHTVAVDGVDLSIADGEFFSMLGPSGSGKTTVLRMIAGFEHATSGRIELDGQDVTKKAPFERDLTTVFQDYALFPHMTVRDNVAYGLMVRKVSKAEQRERAMAALERVQLAHLADRRPSQLSGGQRQRVALARALVVQPKVLLLDEPLGALDLKLRRQMQVELKELHRDLGITFLFVTHDQEEAMTMSDRIAVFNEGRIEQIGTPQEIYDTPQTPFVAGFVGTTNILRKSDARQIAATDTPFAIRPERIHVDWSGAPLATDVRVSGTVVDCVYLGSGNHVRVEVPGGRVLTALTHSQLPDRPDALRGRRVELGWNHSDMVDLPTYDEPENAA